MNKTVESQSILAGEHYPFCHEEFWDITAWLRWSTLGAYCHCGANTWQGQRSECSTLLMLPELYYPFKPFSVIAHSNSQHFPTLNRPDCHSLCRWCHYNNDTLPSLWHCLVWRHSPIIIRADSQSVALATQCTPGNHVCRLVGALSKLREYLCIMSDALGPIKRQKSGGWERQWQEWIKSLIPSFTWGSSQPGSLCVCVCVNQFVNQLGKTKSRLTPLLLLFNLPPNITSSPKDATSPTVSGMP